MIKKKTTDTMPLFVRQSSQILYMHSVVIASFFYVPLHLLMCGAYGPSPSVKDRLIRQVKPQIEDISAFTVDEPPKIVHYSASQLIITR